MLDALRLLGGGLGSVIGTVLLIGVAFAVALAVPFVRRIALRALNLLPAVLLFAVGFVAIVFWRPMDWLMARLLRVVPLDRHVAGLVDRLSQWRLAPARTDLPALLVRGDRREAALQLWPESVFPDLYRDVPDDVARPPFDDGRLIGGMRLDWLGDRHMTDAALRSSARVAATMAGLAFVALTLAALLSAFSGVADAFGQLKGGDALRVEQWPGQEPVPVPTTWIASASLSVIGPTLLRTAGNVAVMLPGIAIACLGLGLLALLLLLRNWQRQKAAPYEWQSKDADVRWAYRTETRNLVRRTYRQQVLLATDYLRGVPSFDIGRASGTLRARGDLSAPTPGQPLRLDQESLFQHLLVFGGTGEGKTTALLKPLIRQLLRRPQFGMYVCDAKGVLWNDVASVVRSERPGVEPIVIGTGPGQKGVDVFAGLTPTQIAGTLRSVMTQLSGGSGGDSFWPDMAANVLRNVLSVAQAYALTELGQAVVTREGMSPYSLWWAYQAVLRQERILEATGALREWIGGAADRAQQLLDQPEAYAALKRTYDRVTTKEVYDSMVYLESSWRDMASETRTGIVANVTQLLDGFAGAAVLRERFASGNPADTISIAAALDGQVVLNALSSVEDGLPARIVTVLIKTNLYREARVREAAFRQGKVTVKPQDRPCIVVMDEVQEIVTVDPTSGLSDATFWNVARSTGVAGIFATQTAAGLYQAVGHDSATNFMQQARSKVFFRTEDRDTVEYACWCAGQYERNRVYDDGHRESIEYRGLIDGWDPLLPVDETEGVGGGASVFFRSALGLLSPERLSLGVAHAQRAYSDDTRFIPKVTSGEGGDVAQIQSLQAAAWRAEDLERDYRKSGNELADALSISDLIHMGRWHAFAQIQRAGAVRQDIIAVDHDFS
ncbi:MAG: type IV secretion system DNA-binding domain-containing protein [Piscinibacter sp.]|nr:type IV secretion system DNA-binding domain-containing protein [Piscinibacter sp.]